MKTKLLFSLICFCSIWGVRAQNMRFIYQATLTPDSTDASSRKTEITYLDTDGKKSYFYSENRIKRDSVMARMRSTRTFDPGQIDAFRSRISYTVEKDLMEQSLVYKDRIGADQYAYTEKQPVTWKILPQTATIGEYKTQKAEAEYGGRTWTAWFTMELPYQDGPYKFFGLPGLIVKVQDAKGDYSFDLMQVKKTAGAPDLQQRGQSISISKDKFRKTYLVFQKDPESYFNANRSAGGRGPGGPPAPPMRVGGSEPNRMQEMRARMMKEIKSNNNPIELK